MNIQNMKYVIEIDRVGSISKAAKNLYMGQPNLSKAVKEMEKALNITIFERTFSGTKTTPEGKAFLKYAKEIILQYEEIKKLGVQIGQEKKSLSLSLPNGEYLQRVLCALLRKKQDSQEFQVYVRKEPLEEVVGEIVGQKIDMAVLRYPAKYENNVLQHLKENELNFYKLFQFQPVVLLSEKHPLAQKEKLEYHDLSPYTEILYEDDALSAYIKQQLLPDIKPPQKIIKGNNLSLDRLLQSNESYLWTLPLYAETLDEKKLVMKKCKNIEKFQDLLVYPQHKPFSSLERIFIADTKKEAFIFKKEII